MMSSKLVSARKPSASARFASKFRGQPSTMRMIAGSGSRRIRRATLSPGDFSQCLDLLGRPWR